MTMHEPLPVPERPDATPPPELDEKEAGLYKAVYEHFAKEGCALPDEEKGEFDCSLQTYECMLRYVWLRPRTTCARS